MSGCCGRGARVQLARTNAKYDLDRAARLAARADSRGRPVDRDAIAAAKARLASADELLETHVCDEEGQR